MPGTNPGQSQSLAFYLAWMSGLEPLMWSGPLWAPYALYTGMTQCQGLERMRVLGLVLVTGVVLLGSAMSGTLAPAGTMWKTSAGRGVAGISVRHCG
jgi:hypothetical protein